jgi:YggT family protein
MSTSVLLFVYKVLMQLIRIYSFVWFIWIVMSWLNTFGVVRINYYNQLIQILYSITDGVIDKVFGRFREKFVVGNMDLSPLVFLFLLYTILPRAITALFNMLLK